MEVFVAVFLFSVSPFKSRDDQRWWKMIGHIILLAFLLPPTLIMMNIIFNFLTDLLIAQSIGLNYKLFSQHALKSFYVKNYREFFLKHKMSNLPQLIWVILGYLLVSNIFFVLIFSEATGRNNLLLLLLIFILISLWGLFKEMPVFNVHKSIVSLISKSTLVSLLVLGWVFAFSFKGQLWVSTILVASYLSLAEMSISKSCFRFVNFMGSISLIGLSVFSLIQLFGLGLKEHIALTVLIVGFIGAFLLWVSLSGHILRSSKRLRVLGLVYVFIICEILIGFYVKS